MSHAAAWLIVAGLLDVGWAVSMKYAEGYTRLRLFTDPSGLDCSGERLDGGIGRQVRHIVFLLSGRPPLAEEPDLVAWHALHPIIEHPVLMAVRNPDKPTHQMPR